MRLSLRQPTIADLEAIRLEHLNLPLSYRAVGATLRGERPRGYFHDTCTVDLGRGDSTFEAAKVALRAWSAHRGAHVMVVPIDASIEVGTVVTMTLPVLGIHIHADCRIVAVLDEPDAYGFAYGTLTTHPETGEESFVIRRAPGGGVSFTVTAFSRPGELVPWCGLPVVRALQHRAARQFLQGMKTATVTSSA